MNKHITSLITRVTIAISKQAKLARDDDRYAQATQDAADILAHLCAYVEALEECVNQIHVATIEAQVSANYPIKTLDQILED